MQDKIRVILNGLGLQKDLIEEILIVGKSKNLAKGQHLISQGAESGQIPLVVEGTLRVSRNDDKGNEMFLYYLEGGETCAMSITCCIQKKESNFNAIAEEDSTLWMIPMLYMEEWMAKYQSFRQFVLESYQQRFEELLLALDSVAFMKTDERLFKFLLDKKQASGSYVINKTHEQIASELNTSRVVISRLLKQLEHEGKIEQGRNRIEVL